LVAVVVAVLLVLAEPADQEVELVLVVQIQEV
jgi:hypothetical protein